MAAAATTVINSTAAFPTPSFSCPSSSSSSSSQRLKLQLLFCNPFNQKKKKNETTLVYETAVSVRCDAALGSSAESLQQLKTSRFDRYTKENSSMVVIGINVHTAPVELCEKLAIPEAQWPLAIAELSALNHIEEAAVFSTCDRMEIYVVALSQHRGVKEVTEWMSKISGIPIPDICKHRFILHNKDAARHLFEVASGLDSVVLGERQILNQVKQVKKLGKGVAGFNRKISGLFEHAIIAGKRVQTETSISSSVSISSAAADLALLKLSLSSYATIRVLVVGAGKMGKLVVQHLVSKGCKRVVVVNRTGEKVTALCEEFKDAEIIYKSLSKMMECAVGADVIFTCTASDTPLILRQHVQELLLLRPNTRKQIFVDISVPRNVEPCVSDLAAVEVYNVDDIKEVVSANKGDRIQKTVEAQSIISDELLKFEAWKDSLEAVPTIKKLRAYAERIRACEIEKCLSKMGDITEQQKKAIYDLSVGILKLFLHGPIEHLRCEASDCHKPEQIIDIMRTINTMYDLEKEILLETVLTMIERTQK